MATSGSSDFNATRDSIIKAAARKVNAIRAGETPGHSLVQDFAEALNAMVKAWQGSGIHVWTTTEGVLFPQANQVRYQLGSGSTDHATESFVQTELSAAAASGATSISVDAITGFSNADNIGVVQNNGTIHWTTINGAPSGSTITLTSGLTDSAAVDATVYGYTNKIVRPLKIIDARWFDEASNQDTPMTPWSRLDYQWQPNKTSLGAVTQYYYDPQLTTGVLYLWQALAVVDGLVKFTWWRPIEDFDSAGDNPDLPQEWIEALIFNLAVRMAPEFSVPPQKFNQVKLLADEALDLVKDFDREHESIIIGVDYD